MNTRKPQTKRPEPRERLWPLDVSIAALAGLVLYLIVSRLRFDDPRWQFNAWTYTVSIPVIALVLAYSSHGLVARHIQKSIQLGFLFSVFVHLLLLMLAINVIIFSRYFPDAVTGLKPERSPIRRTVPEYLFRTPEDTAATPDWAQPVDVETTSRVVPEELRQLPPLETTAAKLEAPRPRQFEPQPMRKLLMKREQLNQSRPQPSDSPARLSTRRTARPDAAAFSSRSPTAPDVPTQQEIEATLAERAPQSPRRLTERSSTAVTATRVDIPLPPSPEISVVGARSRSETLPRVGDLGMQRRRQNPRTTQSMQPAGAAPAPRSVAVARDVEISDRAIASSQVSIQRQGQTAGAQLTLGQFPSLAPATNPTPDASRDAARNNLAASGLPTIDAGRSRRAPNSRRGQSSSAGMEPLGTPSMNPSFPSTDAQAAEQSTSYDQPEPKPGSQLSRQRGGSIALNNDFDPTLDLLLDDGPVGLSARDIGKAGVVPLQDEPIVGSIDLTRGTRPKRDVGGPATPFGTKIAAVESFSRRILRTRGGAAPSPAGTVGPATEEAIERGLAYLAGIQNSDGSWSLQGHGTEVLLRSDSAATGLCLLAFQGAGYTHRQHQYADTVSRGLRFLIANQRTNGDLYRKENQISDQNVALYSHGIAALAVCEAYGMTQDPELKEPAQASLNYIVGTQHQSRGGWRYTPQISSDTSVTGWMMMALKSGQLAGLDVPENAYRGIRRWLGLAQAPNRSDRYRYNPFAPDTPTQRHGRVPTPTMTSVAMLMRMYLGWRRDARAMQSAADYLQQYPPQMGTPMSPQRDAYYWYYATQVMFHMGNQHWGDWNNKLKPILLDSQVESGEYAGSWDPMRPVPDRWGAHAGRLYVTTMNLLNLEVYYRHLPIYDDTAD